MVPATYIDPADGELISATGFALTITESVATLLVAFPSEFETITRYSPLSAVVVNGIENAEAVAPGILLPFFAIGS